MEHDRRDNLVDEVRSATGMIPSEWPYTLSRVGCRHSLVTSTHGLANGQGSSVAGSLPEAGRDVRHKGSPGDGERSSVIFSLSG
jgi:hypothetical protein